LKNRELQFRFFATLGLIFGLSKACFVDDGTSISNVIELAKSIVKTSPKDFGTKASKNT
jgi:hypothetical protein